MKKPKLPFTSSRGLQLLIDAYFTQIQGEYHIEEKTVKKEVIKHKLYDRQPEPPTITGLVFHLGFDSRHSFEAYERNGKYASQIKRASLRIEAEYEKKLHQQPPTGAIFALRSMGWNEKTEKNQPIENEGPFKLEIVETGPKIARNENEVEL